MIDPSTPALFRLGNPRLVHLGVILDHDEIRSGTWRGRIVQVIKLEDVPLYNPSRLQILATWIMREVAIPIFMFYTMMLLLFWTR